MIPHDILTLYAAKMVEYPLAVLFLLLFIPFWRFLHGPSKESPSQTGTSHGHAHAAGHTHGEGTGA